MEECSVNGGTASPCCQTCQWMIHGKYLAPLAREATAQGKAGSQWWMDWFCMFFFPENQEIMFFSPSNKGVPADFSVKQIWNSHDSETRISNQHRNDRAGNAYQTRFLCDHFLWNQLCLSSTTIQSEQSKCSVESYRFRTVSSCSKALHVICISLLQCKWSTSFL